MSWVEETDLVVVELGECVLHCGGAVKVKFSSGDRPIPAIRASAEYLPCDLQSTQGAIDLKSG